MAAGDWQEYRGRRAIVTGCFSGIGRAVAAKLIDNGAEVHGFDYRVGDLAMASFTQVDLRDLAGIEAAAAGCEGAFHAVFNCAGIPPGPPPLDVMKVNYLGTRALNDALAGKLVPGAAIANVASTGGMRWNEHLENLLELVAIGSFAGGAAWCEAHAPMVAEGYRFSKEAVIAWTLASAADYISDGIRINAVMPGAVQTPMLVEIEKATPIDVIDQVAKPIGRRSSPEEQAETLLFLNSPRASYVNGAILPVDGGFMGTLAIRRI